jgi:hypothetical protein
MYVGSVQALSLRLLTKVHNPADGQIVLGAPVEEGDLAVSFDTVRASSSPVTEVPGWDVLVQADTNGPIRTTVRTKILTAADIGAPVPFGYAGASSSIKVILVFKPEAPIQAIAPSTPIVDGRAGSDGSLPTRTITGSAVVGDPVLSFAWMPSQSNGFPNTVSTAPAMQNAVLVNQNPDIVTANSTKLLYAINNDGGQNYTVSSTSSDSFRQQVLFYLKIT